MAKKPTISTITTNYNLAQYVNSNFEAIRDHFEGVLSLDGSTPNSMEADLDLNGNSILNAGDIEVGSLTVGGITFVPNDAVAIPDWEGTWATSTPYAVNDLVYNAGNSYICVVAHTSGVFSSDLSSGYWELFASKGDSGAGTGDLLSTENLSDLADADSALANLGGGSKGIAIFKDTTSEAVRTEIGLGGLATEDILDEDDFASDSATRPPSQQSAKAYVDSAVGGITVPVGVEDLTNVPVFAHGSTSGSIVAEIPATTGGLYIEVDLLIIETGAPGTAVNEAVLQVSNDGSTYVTVATVIPSDSATTEQLENFPAVGKVNLNISDGVYTGYANINDFDSLGTTRGLSGTATGIPSSVTHVRLTSLTGGTHWSLVGGMTVHRTAGTS